MLRKLHLLILGLAFAPFCAAQVLRVCIDDQPFPPLTFPDREGQVQYLIRQAASQQGWAVQFLSVPRRRCHAGVASGEYHAAAPVSATTGVLDNMILPELDGSPDAQRSFGVVRAVVFRVRGSQADWDGQRFSGLDKPVLYGSGLLTFKDRLEALKVPSDDSAKSLSQIMTLLVIGRGQIAVSTEYQTLAALKEGGLEDRIEVLPVPFMQSAVFLGVGRGFYAANQQVIERIWTTIGELRAGKQ